MKHHTRDGIPSRNDYRNLLREELFTGMENYSNKFLSDNKDILAEYSKKWVADPLHQWSRQWEYPYVLDTIREHLSGSTPATFRILDAGSGVTFFPFYLNASAALAEMRCCDYDANLAGVFDGINSKLERKVGFTFSDLQSNPFGDGYFDVVYCISVLEHTRNYPGIIEEFYRALKPGGRLILTFDISLDRTEDISPENALELLKILSARFDSNEDWGSLMLKQLEDKTIFTTDEALKMNPMLLPWRRSKWSGLKELLSGKKAQRWPPLLTFFCVSFVKK